VAAETPEGILLDLRPAGVVVRLYAFLVDWGIRLVILYVAAIGNLFVGDIGFAFWLILLFALEWIYPIVFELRAAGASPGKRAFGLKVVMENGLPVTAAASVTRNLLRAADFLPFGFGCAIVAMLTRPDCKRLGDIAAATLVVYSRREVTRGVLDEIPTVPAVAPLAPAQPLGRDDQAALIALAARAPRLTPARLDELAALAAVVSGDEGQSGPQVTRRVLGVAQWALGRR
jgi:uncharacterized RDD family membrane protein YckC